MITIQPPSRRTLRSGAELAVVLALVGIAASLVIVVTTNLGTSADIRKESQEAHLLGEMQIALTTVETAVAEWQLDPAQYPHPASNPSVQEAVVVFDAWQEQLLRLVQADEVPVVEGFATRFNAYVAAATTAPVASDATHARELSALSLAARIPLLRLLDEENDHLITSVEAGRQAEQLLRWGLPVLALLAVVVMGFVLRLRNRGRQLAEQRKINEAQIQFIGAVSHELRTPLTSVVAYSHELRDRVGDFSRSELREFVETIAQESDEVAAIVDDLLVAARLEVDQLVIAPEPLDIRSEIDHALATIADADSIDIDAGGTLLADRGRLRQILRNLVSNARRYGGEQIRISSALRGGEMLIVVADSGPAIPIELHGQIFKPFATASTVPGAPASVGLGLTVSRHLATMMGGSLTYTHEDGWSRLNLTLPTRASGNGAVKSEDALQVVPTGR